MKLGTSLAVVGAGQWGKNLIRNFHSLGVLKIICDSNQEALKLMSSSYPEVITTSHLDEVLGDPHVTAIAISTPAETHYELVKQALEAQKDVFVEKPLALTREEGEELCSLASESNRILMIGHLLHYHPAVVKLKELVANGELGKLQYIYSNRLNLGRIRKEENILWSFAPHDISLIISLAGELPEQVICTGGSYLHPRVADVTLSSLVFPSGIRAHVFVSWLHPFKEQRLVIVGDRKMAVFDDTNQENKLLLYPHRIEWKGQVPIPDEREAEKIELENKEPLREECTHFLECVKHRIRPRTDGKEAVNVLTVLDGCERSLEQGGMPVEINSGVCPHGYSGIYVEKSAVIDPGCSIGQGTRIWHFSHIIRGSKIGRNCTIGQNVMIGPNSIIGDEVKIQNNVSVYEGVTLENGVFCGPSVVFTNVYNPRSYIPRKNEIKSTLVREGASLGANCTVVCGHTIGRFAFVAAGAVVVNNVPDFALVAGNPAVIKGWMCRCGFRLHFHNQRAVCDSCGTRYLKEGNKVREEN